MVRTIEFRDGALLLIDQRKLPLEETYVRCTSHLETAEAIRSMVVRGAPAIGVTAAFGMALAAREMKGSDAPGFLQHLESAGKTLGETRPTAVNLFWAIRRCLGYARAESAEGRTPLQIAQSLLQLAREMHDEDIAVNRRIGDHGAALIGANARVLTHCNAGALATAGYGTAAGVRVSYYLTGMKQWRKKTVTDPNHIRRPAKALAAAPAAAPAALEPAPAPEDALEPAQKSKILQLTNITSVDEAVAQHLLEAAGWDVQRAVENFFAAPAPGAGPPAALEPQPQPAAA